MASGEELRQPKKKKGADKLPRESPLPIPIESITGKPACKERWYQYFGILRGNMVAVERLGDMTFLYKMGFFGKGNLSRSKPEFDQCGNTFDERCKQRMCGNNSRKLTTEEKEIKEMEFIAIHNERLKQHQNWSAQKKSDETEIPAKQFKPEDPYKINEFLQLSLEEAFFLSFGLGCLTVMDAKKEPIKISELWNRFREIKPRFLETYATYHYFRSFGWVVRDGMLYGSDFMLYKEGMPFYHSSYVILAYLVEDGRTGETEESLPWTWPYLTCLNRVAEHVAKEVLISLVYKPKDLTEEDLASPLCLEKFEVQEILLRRWISEKSRDEKKQS